jgi:dGTPase
VADILTWDRLLDTTRVRMLMTERGSVRSDADARGELERDYGRVIFSTPVRRLQDKAQVFPMEPHDAVRTRLTHSLEVSSVARGIGSAVGKWLDEQKVTAEAIRPAVETIAATCGILHDLGNPPFGHAGEDAIQTWFAERAADDKDFAKMLDDLGHKNPQFPQDFRRFEGNAQTIRLISKLQIFADFHGLNLTCATLSAASKYIAPSHMTTKAKHEWRKPGYFASENELVKRVRERTGTGEARHPIAYLVEAADDTVYAFVDLEDGVKKKVVLWNEVASYLENATRDKPEAFTRAKGYAERALAEAPMTPMEREEALASGFRTFAIAECVKATIDVFTLRYDAIMREEYHGELLFDDASAVKALVSGAKNFGRERVYVSADTLRIEVLGRNVIHSLMDHFWEATKEGGGFAGRLYKLISPNYRRVYEHNREEHVLPDDYLRLQLATDQVAGMTDTFASNLHRQLTNG